MAHRHEVHKRAMRAGKSKDPVEAFEKKDKYGEDKAANGEGYKPSATMAEAKGARSRDKDKDAEGAIHGNRIKGRPGRRMGGGVGADRKPLSSAGAGLGMAGMCRATGGAVGEFAKGGKVERDKYSSGGGNWIAKATEKKGALHKHLGVPEGEKIPAKKLAKAEHSSNPTIKKEANLAKTLKGMHH